MYKFPNFMFLYARQTHFFTKISLFLSKILDKSNFRAII